MALIKCPECGKEFSNKAPACPNCGCPTTEIQKMKHTKTIIIDNKEYDVTHIVQLLNQDKFEEAEDELQQRLDEEGYGEDDAYYICEAIEDGDFSPWVYNEKLKCLTYTETREELQAKQNIPHCPNCNSTNIQKISMTSRAISGLTFGILSSSIGKTYKCNNCGYKW